MIPFPTDNGPRLPRAFLCPGFVLFLFFFNLHLYPALVSRHLRRTAPERTVGLNSIKQRSMTKVFPKPWPARPCVGVEYDERERDSRRKAAPS